MADDRHDSRKRTPRKDPGAPEVRRPGGDGDDAASAFFAAMEDVDRLEEGVGRIMPKKASPRRRVAAASLPRGKPRFQVERLGERIEALARGGDRRQLRALERGEIPVDERLDLHRLTEKAARLAVEALLERAVAEDLRCLLLIHGRGLRSPAGPVLKEALPRWLESSPHASRILAFASAPPRLGREGATLVLLRRRWGRGRG